MTVLLYGAPCSVYTRSARLALIEKGVDYRLEMVDLHAAPMLACLAMTDV